MTTTPALTTEPVRKSQKNTPWWAKVLLVVVVLGLIGAAGAAGISLGKTLGVGEERSVQIVRSVQGEEQVILMTAGLSDIKPQKDQQSFFGLFEIPFSERELYIQYDFDAKFGIEGKEVTIEQTGDDAYTITIPRFIFLGYNDPNFKVATETNGFFSWVTPEIDKMAAIEEIITDAQIAEHVEHFRPLLETQAETFYSRIVNSIAPEAVLTFNFTD